MPETAYTLPVAVDTRLRHYHQTQARRVVEFVVQLEVEVREVWKPVIRYDTAHGFAHIAGIIQAAGLIRNDWR